MKRAVFIERIRKVLLRRRDALRRSINGELALLGRNWMLRSVGDLGDDARSVADDEITSRVAQAESSELRAVETALARIREGQYGECEECGESIPAMRLQALPYATLCIRCQRARETGRVRRHQATKRAAGRASDRGPESRLEAEGDLIVGR